MGFKSLSAYALVGCLMLLPTAAGADIFVVSNTDDSGDGSLRKAIIDANDNAGEDSIRVVLPANSVIAPTSQLPALSDDAGTSIAGGDVQLSGLSAQAGSVGLRLLSNNNVVESLTITSFQSHGVYIEGDNNRVSNCTIGTDGVAALPNLGSGVHIESGSGNTVGVNSEGGSGNLISGNLLDGIHIAAAAEDTVIAANHIGLNVTADATIPNAQHGVNSAGPGTLIGGTTEAERNVISGNAAHGINATGTNNTIQGNRIGLPPVGDDAFGNSLAGVLLNGQNILVGGDTAEAGNIIANSGSHGIQVVNSQFCTFRRNSIYESSINPIDMLISSNAGILPPVINGLFPVTGTALPNGTVDFYADNENEAEFYIGSVQADEIGEFSIAFNLLAFVGLNLTATVTGPPPGNNTSILSAPIEITTPPEICGDTIDNDDNGFTDCDDFACSDDEFCTGETSCNDGLDNDQNGFTDCDDFNCADNPVCANPLMSCPEDAAFSQPPSEITNGLPTSDESDGGIRLFEKFSGLSTPITGIVWWGGGLSPNPCIRDLDNFQIAFYNDNGNQPAQSPVATRTVLPANAQSTGEDVGLGDLLRYEVTFDTPVSLASGWVSVFGVDNVGGCYFYWAHGEGGDNAAYSSIAGSLNTDLAVCLISGPLPEICGDQIDNDENGFTDCDDFACANDEFCSGETTCDDGIDNDQNGFTDCDDFGCAESPACQVNPQMLCPAAAAVSQPPADVTSGLPTSDESDGGIRLYDKFSGLSEPITGIAWWGGGLSPNPCLRDQDNFEIAFYNDNGNQPAANAVATRTVSPAPSQSTGDDVGLGDLRLYQVTFDTPVDLASGWVSVFGVGNIGGCYFYWAHGEGGDNAAYSSISGSLATDLAFCLLTGPPVEICNDGFDNDNDSFTDCDDFDCIEQEICTGETTCDDSIDNDQNGFTDCDDFSCAGDPVCLIEGEGEGQASTMHTADQDENGAFNLSELLRVVQFYNSGGLHCAANPETTEDGYVAGANALAQTCAPHASDYGTQDWVITLSELLQLIQLYNAEGYIVCEEESGYCIAVK